MQLSNPSEVALKPWDAAAELYNKGDKSWIPVTEQFSDEMLNVLPPIYVGKAFGVSEPYLHDDAGNGVYLFIRQNPPRCRLATVKEIRAELSN